MHGLNRGKRNAGFRPQPAQYKLLSAGFLDRGHKVVVIQEFMDERSIGSRPGKSVLSCGHIRPLNDLVSTVDRMVGTSKILVAFASATTLLMIDWRSKFETPNNI